MPSPRVYEGRSHLTRQLYKLSPRNLLPRRALSSSSFLRLSPHPFLPRTAFDTRVLISNTATFMMATSLMEITNQVVPSSFQQLDHIAKALNSAKKVIVVAGAGISTAAGIPVSKASLLSSIYSTDAIKRTLDQKAGSMPKEKSSTRPHFVMLVAERSSGKAASNCTNLLATVLRHTRTKLSWICATLVLFFVATPKMWTCLSRKQACLVLSNQTTENAWSSTVLIVTYGATFANTFSIGKVSKLKFLQDKSYYARTANLAPKTARQLGSDGHRLASFSRILYGSASRIIHMERKFFR